MSDETLYKALDEDGTRPDQGHEWSLPTRDGDGWKPGEWEDAGPGELAKCQHGIHAATIRQLPLWLHAHLYVLEPAEGTDRLDVDDKTVVRRARLVRPVETWTATTARLYAADCAEMVLPIYEDKHPDEDRPRRAIEVARAYARGEATDKQLAAAGAAAGAAWAAAGAARDAAGAAWAAAWDIMSDRLALYLEHGETAAEEPVPDIRDLLEEPTDE